MKPPLPFLILISAVILSCSRTGERITRDITIENEQVKLVISPEGFARSLTYKPSKTECLIKDKKIPFSTITEERPYQNEVKLAYPTKKTTFKSNSIRKEGDKLVIGYELIPWEATVSLKITGDYLGFTLEGFRLTVDDYGIALTEPPVSEMWFVRLPVRNLTHYGDWLNVLWDDKMAVNLLSTDPYANVDSEEGDGFRIMQAGVDVRVKPDNTGAALIVCPSDKLLDKIAVVEENFDLPSGVRSRRNKLYNASYYWSADVTPTNVDEHIKYALQGGFRTMMIYYPAFLESNGYRLLGNYDMWRAEYPEGKEDLRKMLDKIKSAGITPGVHFLHSHIGRDSRYVTPVPDHRLNLLRIFTLARPLGKSDTIIYVEQNPANSTMANGRRVLKAGTELISYREYTTSRPYMFKGCIRGIDETTVNSLPAGFMFGLLDVSEFGATSVYIDQNSDLQDEIADKIAGIYNSGFEFMYFDGSEGVNPPFWHHVANAQYRVFSKLKPEPLFAEGAAKTHFSWHMLTGGNAFDIFRPEVLKEETRRHPFAEAPRMKNNFTRLNFGWLGYWVPDGKTIGTQPDMLEYVTSRAAAWDCPVSIHANTAAFSKHPRTADNLEVLRRWEEVRALSWLTEDQKKMLQNGEQEHILLLNGNKEFELVPYEQIADVAGGSPEIRAFIFTRDNESYVVYWHISGNRKLSLPVHDNDFTLMKDPGQEIQTEVLSDGSNSIVPAGDRRYIKTGKLTKEQLIDAFRKARIID
ncbi:MAG: hypothetical protein GYA41_04275 [Bacteroidales bacterium]|nr:hypothetical protein [Bacteroidales bacterium]